MHLNTTNNKDIQNFRFWIKLLQLFYKVLLQTPGERHTTSSFTTGGPHETWKKFAPLSAQISSSAHLATWPHPVPLVCANVGRHRNQMIIDCDFVSEWMKLEKSETSSCSLPLVHFCYVTIAFVAHFVFIFWHELRKLLARWTRWLEQFRFV